MRSLIRLALSFSAVVLIAAACSSDNNVLELAAGDCFNDPEDGATLIFNVDMVDCSEPHDNEVFHVYEIDALGTEESYFNDCLGFFEGYVGSDYATSEIFLSQISPTAEGFADGDNEVVCIAFLEPPNKLTGSVQNSGR